MASAHKSGEKVHFPKTTGQKAHGDGTFIKTTHVAPGNNKSYGVTSVKIKVGKHPKRSIRSSPVPYVSHVDVQDLFAKKYGFRKSPTGRSPVSGWEHAHILSDTHVGYHIPEEHKMVHGHPHEFKCHSPKGKHHCGALRLSGHHKAHQVGKR